MNSQTLNQHWNVFTFILVSLLLLFCVAIPLYQGSNRAVLWALNAIVVAFLFCLVHLTDSGKHNDLRRPWLGFGALILLVGWIGVAGVRGLFEVHLDLQSGELTTLLDIPPLISFSPSDSLWTCMAILSFAMLWSLSRKLAAKVGSQTLLLIVLMVFGLHAAIGLLEITVDYQFPLIEPNFDDFGAVADGGFSNRNTFATYLGLGAVMALALTLRCLSELKTTAVPVSQIITAIFTSCAFVLIVTVLILTQSRMGVTSTAIALVLVTIGFGLVYRSWIIVGIFFGLVVLGIGGAVYASVELLERLEDSGVNFEIRQLAYQEGLSLWMQRPLTGFGAGSFETVFNAYKSEALGFAIWDMAHNTYVTVLFELGGIGAALMLIIFFWLTLQQFRTLSLYRGGGGLAGLGCLVVVSVHALLDYSLEIYAVTATLMVILGIGAAPVPDMPLKASTNKNNNERTLKPSAEHHDSNRLHETTKPKVRQFKPSAAPPTTSE